MRTLVVFLALAAATPVLAQTPLPAGRSGPVPGQPYAGLERHADARTAADEQALRQREVALQNQLSAEAAHAQANQAVGDLKATGVRPDIPPAAINPNATPAAEMSQFAEIPNAALAASNARAVAASQNKK